MEDHLKANAGNLKESVKLEILNQLRNCCVELSKLDNLLYYLPIGYVNSLSSIKFLRNYYESMIANTIDHEKDIIKLFENLKD